MELWLYEQKSKKIKNKKEPKTSYKVKDYLLINSDIFISFSCKQFLRKGVKKCPKQSQNKSLI